MTRTNEKTEEENSDMKTTQREEVEGEALPTSVAGGVEESYAEMQSGAAG